jgi:hypothetical protein
MHKQLLDDLKKKNTVNTRRRKHCIAMSGELALEEAMDLM